MQGFARLSERIFGKTYIINEKMRRRKVLRRRVIASAFYSSDETLRDDPHVLRRANRHAQIRPQERRAKVADKDAVIAQKLLNRRGVTFRRLNEEEVCAALEDGNVRVR